MQNLGLKPWGWLAVIVWCFGLLTIAGAQEPDCNPLCRELEKAGFKVLDLGTAYGVPYVEIKVPVGASVASISRRVPSLSADFFRNRDKIGFFNGVNPFYVKTLDRQPFSLEADTLKIPLNPGLDPEIFPAYEDSLASYDKFILVDLGKGFLALYARGELERVFPISGGTSGRETPLIDFKIKAKDKEHWSSIYDVWMPWSLLVKAPYYIHGGVLPGDNDSAGCIRMFRQDARELYYLVEVGTPGRIIQTSRIEQPSPSSSFPQLSAEAESKDSL
jgi:hypothetical protein